MDGYRPRVVDDELDELLDGLAAVALEGPKAVGKTATASRRATTVLALDDPGQLAVLAADAQRIHEMAPPVLIDEWQRLPVVWDAVRRSVDRNFRPGRFILAGSAAPVAAPVHSGAGRIARVRMRPMSLAERGLDEPSVRLRDLLSGRRPDIGGSTDIGVASYAEEIVRSGFPGIRQLSPRLRRVQLNGYIAGVIERDFTEQGHRVRRPSTLRAWLASYAAATSTATSYNAILDAATSGETDKPAKATTVVYRDVLSQLWLIDPLPGWTPNNNEIARLAQAPKHHLADPALAARILGVDIDGLLSGDSPSNVVPRRDGILLGQLFESLVALSLRVYAQAADACVSHLRSRNGDREVDFIVERDDRRIIAVEVKLAAAVDDADVKHLHWLQAKMGPDLVDAVVITTGRYAYRRPDGIAVIPAALLGP